MMEVSPGREENLVTTEYCIVRLLS